MKDITIWQWLAKPKAIRVGLTLLLIGCLMGSVVLLLGFVTRWVAMLTVVIEPLAFLVAACMLAGLALLHTHVFIFSLLSMGVPFLPLLTSLEGPPIWRSPLYWIIVVPSTLFGVYIVARCSDERKRMDREKELEQIGAR